MILTKANKATRINLTSYLLFQNITSGVQVEPTNSFLLIGPKSNLCLVLVHVVRLSRSCYIDFSNLKHGLLY